MLIGSNSYQGIGFQGKCTNGFFAKFGRKLTPFIPRGPKARTSKLDPSPKPPARENSAMGDDYPGGSDLIKTIPPRPW